MKAIHSRCGCPPDYYREHAAHERVLAAETTTPGFVTASIEGPRGARENQVSCGCDGILPLRRRFGSEGSRRRSGDEVALKVERVVDGSVHIEKALGRASRLEPLHLTLSSPHDLVGVFGAVVRP
jgi:hypothetical protein